MPGRPTALSCSGSVFPARSEPLSFFDEGDEPPTRTVRTPRARRPAAASPGSATPDSQQIMVRRAIGLGGVVIVLLILFLGIKGCANSAKKDSLRSYNTDVASLARDSDTQVSRPFFQLLANPSRTSPVNVEAQVNQYRAAAQDQAKRARGLSVPGQMVNAQRNVELALDLRAGALAKVADKIRAALGNGDAASGA